MPSFFFVNGIIARPPKIGFMADGTPWCHLNIRDTEKGQNGKEYTSYHDLPLFGPLATDAEAWREGDCVWARGTFSRRKNRTTGKYELALRVLGLERMVVAPAAPAPSTDMTGGGGADEGGEIPY